MTFRYKYFKMMLLAVPVLIAGCTPAPSPQTHALPVSMLETDSHPVLRKADQVRLDRVVSVQIVLPNDAREGARLLAGSGRMLGQILYELFDVYTHVAPVPSQPWQAEQALQAAREYGAGYVVQVQFVHWQDDVTPAPMRSGYAHCVMGVIDARTGKPLFSQSLFIPSSADEGENEAQLRTALAQIIKRLYENN